VSRIDSKHGNTRVGSLRKTCGEHFAKGRRKDMMLKTLLAETGTNRFTPICTSITNCRTGLDPAPSRAGTIVPARFSWIEKFHSCQTGNAMDAGHTIAAAGGATGRARE
jgi:hypothetical protein